MISAEESDARRLLGKKTNELLRKYGFSRKGNNWVKRLTETVACVNLQKSRWALGLPWLLSLDTVEKIRMRFLEGTLIAPMSAPTAQMLGVDPSCRA